MLLCRFGKCHNKYDGGGKTSTVEITIMIHEFEKHYNHEQENFHGF